MKEMFENEDELLGLVRKQGLLKPSADFTSRVMQAIGEARDPAVYQPLLSKKAWVFLTGGFVMAIILCWYFFSTGKTNSDSELLGSFDRVRNYMNHVDLSLKFDANAILIITLAILSMGILIILDLWFSNTRKQDTI